jgi:hypothetical protein
MAKPRVHRTALPVKDIDAAAKSIGGSGWSFENNQYFLPYLDRMRRKVKEGGGNCLRGSSSARARARARCMSNTSTWDQAVSRALRCDVT